ncbi:MAG: HD-GYP domain-containing protein [Oscillospiraceae bacterium]|nr:HD-GYP domain-containing protein [Oscillospiraceae bacterium]
MIDFNITNIILVMLYVAEAGFFVFVTKKCFFEKLPFYKAILLLLLSPSTAHLLSAIIGEAVCGSDDSVSSLLLYCTIVTLLLVAFQILFLLLYIKIVHAINRSVALFLYLCSTMLVPGITMVFSTDYPAVPIICTILLSIAFYFLAVRQLIRIAREKQITNPKLFVTLPVIVFLYKTVSLFFGMYQTAIVLEAVDETFVFLKTLNKLSEEAEDQFKELFISYRSYFSLDPLILYVSDLFILIVLLGAFSLIARNIMYMNETKRAHDEVKTLAVEMMEALAHTIDAKDKYTRGHSVRVAKYSRMIAEKMGLSEKECEDVYYYGLLHDLGKIGVPSSIINSPTKLSDEEYSLIRTHPEIGYEILSEVHSRPDLAIGARWHHERYDGKGYPDGKAGEEIPLLARIIAVADSYDAMTSNRSYRNYLAQNKVKEEIEKNSGTQFDPEVARMMIAIINEDTAYTLHE